MSINVKTESLKAIKWTAISKFSNQFIGFFIGVLLARKLSPDDYGLLGLLGVFTALTGSFIDCGFGNALVRKIDRTEADKCTVFYYNIGMSILIYAIMFFAAPFIADFYDRPILIPITRISCLSMIIGSLAGVSGAHLTFDLRFKEAGIIGITSQVVSGIVGVAMAYSGYGVWSLVVQGLVGCILGTVLNILIVRWRPQLIFSIQSFKELFSYGSKLMMSGWLHTIYSQITPLVVGKYYSPADLGFYSRARGYVTLPTGTFMSIVQSVVFPILSHLQEDDNRLADIYRKYIKMAALVIFWAMFTLIAVAEPLISFMVTDKWLPCVPLMRILSFAFMFDFVCSINLSLLQVKGRSDLFLRLEIIKKTVSILMLLASLPYGINAMCWSIVIYTQFAIAVNTYYTGKMFHLGYWTQVKDFMPYFLIAGLVALPTYGCTLLPIPHLGQLALAGIVSVALYITIMRMKHDEMYLIIEDIFLSKVSKLINRF